MALDRLGRYEIIEELGRGSMGVVYKARDPLLDRTLALKTVALDLSAEEAQAFEQRFYREAKSAGRLSHPNIVTIHDVGKSDSIAYIAMEFLQGRSLREILDSGVVLPVEKIVDIAAQVADGLAFAHASGVVHRDIKPPNIMVLDSGAVKITDFGIALLPTGSRTLTGTVFGSPKYMSPEQVVGRPVDGRADIFSLGAVLYEMLTGFAPFFGGDLEAILYRVINEMPAAPTSRNRSLPAAFDGIVAKALAKHPDDRYGDARAFAADLRGFRELRPPAAPLPAQRTLERRAIRRRKGELPPRPSAVPAPGPADAKPAAATRRGLGVALLASVPIAALFFAGAATWVRLVSNGVASAEPRVAARAVQAPTSAPTPVSAAMPETEPRIRTVAEPGARATGAPTTTGTSTARTQPVRSTAKPSARLLLAVSPWGEVYVDGRKRGVSPPLAEIRLAPGRHRVEIRNSAFPAYAETVNLRAEAAVKVQHRFR
jgi:serine/threonine-protein kinase